MTINSEVNDQIETKIFEIVARIAQLERQDITASSDFYMDLGIDSLDKLELVVELEKALGVKIDDRKAGKLRNIADVLSLQEI